MTHVHVTRNQAMLFVAVGLTALAVPLAKNINIAPAIAAAASGSNQPAQVVVATEAAKTNFTPAFAKALKENDLKGLIEFSATPAEDAIAFKAIAEEKNPQKLLGLLAERHHSAIEVPVLKRMFEIGKASQNVYEMSLFTSAYQYLRTGEAAELHLKLDRDLQFIKLR